MLKSEDLILCVIPSTFIFIFSGYFKMGLGESFLAALLAALVGALIIFIVKSLNKPKICALICVNKPCDDKCSASILLWNPSWIKTVCGGDFGEYGLCITSDYYTSISDLKLNKITWAKEFNYSVQPETSKNLIKLRIGNMPSKSLVEFEFNIYNKLKTTERSGIILLPNVKTTANFTQTPCVSLLSDNAKINVRSLKYYRFNQFVKRFCSLAFRVIPILLALTIVLYVMFPFIEIIPKIFSALLLSMLFFIISFGAIGDTIPAFVMKYIKSKKREYMKK